MTKLSISLAVTTTLLLGTAACERKEVEKEVKDVEKAEEKVQEKEQAVEQAKTELREKKAELAVEVQDQLNEAEKRFKTLDEQTTAVTKTIDTTAGVGAELQQAHMLAKAKLEAARTATSEDMQKAINEAKDAIDKLEKKLNEYNESV